MSKSNFIGYNLIQLRQAKKLTQQELAEILGKDRGTVINYEKGKSIPDEATLLKLTKAYNLDVYKFTISPFSFFDDFEFVPTGSSSADKILYYESQIENLNRLVDSYKDQVDFLKGVLIAARKDEKK